MLPPSLTLTNTIPRLGSAALPPHTEPPLCGMLIEARGGSPSLCRKNGVNEPWLKNVPPYESSSARQAATCSGVVSCAVTTSSGVHTPRLSCSGLIGYGWVGLYHSPGTSAAATGRSSTPWIGSPVSRLRMYIRPGLPVSASAGMRLPSTVTSNSTGGAGRSQSHRSWWIVWKCHLYLPVVASTATIELPNRLLPGRSPP